jgi:hypothetical protein
VPKPELEFFDPLAAEGMEWRVPEGDTTGQLRELILTRDPETGDYTRLLRFPPNADTRPNGVVTHDFWEEVWILEGAIHDVPLGQTFTKGMYACRPPGMAHGPWTSEMGALTIELRYWRRTGDSGPSDPRR